MKVSAFFVDGGSLYSVYTPEQDILGARWLASQIGNDSTVHADYGMGITTLTAFTSLDRQNIDYITNETPAPRSYIYLRSLNVFESVITTYEGYYSLSDLPPSFSQNCRIYSNGASDVCFLP
jgi:uncharacterized membrane protein